MISESLELFGNEIPDQVGDDVIAILVMTSWPVGHYHHDRLGHNVIAGWAPPSLPA